MFQIANERNRQLLRHLVAQFFLKSQRNAQKTLSDTLD